MITRLLLALLFFLVATPFSVAQSSIENRLADRFDTPLPLLRSQVVVTSDLVTLGDLFDHAGIHAETPVFQAPAPGTRGRVETYIVLEAAQRAGLDIVDLAGLSEITVERAGLALDAADFERMVQDALDRHLADLRGEGAGRFAITWNASPASVTIPAEEAEGLSVDFRLTPSGRSERFAAVIRTRSGQEIAQLDGRAEHRVLVPVLGRAVGRGDVIRASDLRLQDVSFARTVGTPTLTDAEDIIGQAARRSLRAGATFNPDDLTAPLMIERQDLVTLVYRHGALALTVRARAIDDGAEGQAIDVMNLQSNRVVRGLVAGPGLVHVLGPIQDFAASSSLSLSTAQSAERIQ